MTENYCQDCDAITTQIVVEVLWGRMPLGTCQVCGSANPVGERQPPFPLSRIFHQAYASYAGRRAAFELRREHERREHDGQTTRGAPPLPL